ncbi:hypothetical protein KJ359_001752 [Pestalotiopsis sp. 9143b]|nr:hypothetical protein KJ359_001752 [Pestalotiopsis sp. 9143b]
MILRSACVASSVHLSQEESIRLKHIAGLAPTRQFYPSNEKVMQTVLWSPEMSFTSQHSLFYTVAKNLLANLQRADRLLERFENEAELIKELQNPGHEDWNPMEYPEWLLMECDSGFLIRRVQHQIALQMMDPLDGGNATMQLNMGEGKSSVIAPSIALALANGSQLLRLIVTKPQFHQMLQILLARLGNLVGRRVFQLPVSRDIRFDSHKILILRRVLKQCREKGGVILVQPEHLLSFQLMGIEQMISGEATLARALLDTQCYLDTHSRDIIDESDEVLSVKFELVYTIGQQRPTEHSPQRWIVIQQMLEYVRQLAPSIVSAFPQSLEVHNWHHESRRYPRIRIFREDALRRLLELLSETICEEGLQGFPIARQPASVRRAVQKYISIRNVSPTDVEVVEKGQFWTDAVICTLLLLRGLIAGGVIGHALSHKRWRVNYGVHEDRVPKTRLAVPFRAKDDPAPRSEFSHPDVVMVLTSLSYYYSGLKDEDLFDSFCLLKNSDQATSEYSVWDHDAPSLPRSYRDLAGINLRDRIQCSTTVFPHLRYSKGAVDYFMSHIIFAKEMKEFPHKLSASGWDLCKVKSHSVTGFSGTNDSRYTLPASIRQLDLPQQTHTNALVLDYLSLGQNVTKDRLVQACMRMRMLGHGQSVVFCIPNEIKNNIMQQQPVSIGSDITVTHVLTWAIRETHFDTKKSAPLWATQASRFYKQDRNRQEQVDSQEEYSSTWAKRFLEAEAHSLERRYRPGFSGSSKQKKSDKSSGPLVRKL